jgi:hypothetical protein
MTDGQELWSGSHVWKTDGSVITDITADVRNAGISRVDDVVSDGQRVLFLKNVFTRDNSFEVVSFDGNYKNLTSYFRGYFNSYEGLNSVQGKNGIWMFITTTGRVLKWNTGSNTVEYVNLPSGTYAYTQNQGVGKYSMRHVSPGDDANAFSMAVAPLGNDWFFVLTGSNSNPSYMRYYKYTNGTFSEVTAMSSINYVHALASNGTQVLVGGGANGITDRVFVYDGVSVKDVSSAANTTNLNNWNRAMIAYDGKSWMIMSGKKLVRFDGTNFAQYQDANDYIATIAGSGDGRFLVGGAVSVSGLSTPSSPLKAKLLRVDEGTNYNNSLTVSGDTIPTVKGKKNYINYWSWYEPNAKQHDNISDPKYSVGAQSNYGIKKVELYINDVRQKVCDGKNSKKNVICAMFIESSAYPYYSNVGAFAKITDSKGRVAYVPASIVQFYDAGGTSGNSFGLSAQMTASPQTSNLGRNQSASVSITANATQGLNRIDVYVNGLVKYSCPFNSQTYATCNYTIYGSSYTAGSAVAFNARAVDQQGHDVWTWLGTYNIVEQGSASGNLSAWMWFDPSGSTLYSDTNKAIKVQANAVDGLQRIEIYVNGVQKQYCGFGRAYGTQSCQTTITGNSYAQNSSLPVYAIAYDYTGQQTTVATQYLNVYGYSNVSLSTWFDSNISTSNLGRNDSRKVKIYGTSGNGLRSLQLYVNDASYGTCNFSDIMGITQPCEFTLYGSNYSDGQWLTLKSKATDMNGNVAWSSGTTGFRVSGAQTSNTTISSWITPEKTEMTTSDTVNYYAQAYNASGILRIELWDGTRKLDQCSYTEMNNTRQCTTVVRGSDYTNDTYATLQARAYDWNGNVAYSESKTIKIHNGTTNNATTLTSTVSPAKSSFNRNESMTYSVEANDPDGLQGIRLYVNGTQVNDCSIASKTYGVCSANLSMSNYSAGSVVTLQARAIDSLNNVTWSSSQQISVTDTTSYVDVPGTISITSDASNGYTGTQSITFTATGSDQNGVDHIEILVNAMLAKTCTGVSTCSYTGSGYTTYDTVTFGANLYDSLGNRVWTGYKSINKIR